MSLAILALHGDEIKTPRADYCDSSKKWGS